MNKCDENGAQENVLYKVFVAKSNKSPGFLDRNNLMDMFCVYAEPLKVYIDEKRNWGFVYFGTRKDAQMCSMAFNGDPPYYYRVEMAQDEVYHMKPDEVEKMNDLYWKLRRKLYEIEAQIRELNIEKIKLKNRLKAFSNFDQSGSEDNDCIDSNERGYFRQSSFSSSHTSLIENDNHRARSRTRRTRHEDTIPSRSRSRPNNKYDNFQVTVSRGKSLDKSSSAHHKNENCNSDAFDNSNEFNSTQREKTNAQQGRLLRQNQSENKNNIDNYRRTHNSNVNKPSHDGDVFNTRRSVNNVNLSQENRRSNEISTESNKDQSALGDCKREKLPSNNFVEAPNDRIRKPAMKPFNEDSIKLIKPLNTICDNRKCITDLLTLEHSGGLKLKTILNKNLRTSTAQLIIHGDFLDQVNIIESIWMNYSNENAVEPKPGDFVCVENEDGWSRGYILSQQENAWRVALVDEGTFVLTTNVCKLLPEHVNIPDFACLCKVTKMLVSQSEFLKLFEVNKLYCFVIKSVDENKQSVTCIVKNRKTKQDYFKAELSRWIPQNIDGIDSISLDNNVKDSNSSSNCLAVKQHKLESQSLVILEDVESQQIMYVTYRESAQYRKQINELMEAYGKSLPQLTDTPKVGQHVAAKFSEDGKWYRAEIISVDSDNDKATVLYIDYGNKETLDIDDIRVLLEPMLEMPAVLRKIKLKGLPSKPITTAQHLLIKQFFNGKTKLKMVFDCFEDGVTLYNINSNDKKSLNELLLEAAKSKRLSSQSTSVVTSENKKLTEETKKINSEESNSKSKKTNPKELVTNTPENQSNPLEPISSSSSIKEYVDGTLPLGKTSIVLQSVVDAKDRIIVCSKDDVQEIEYVHEVLTSEIDDYVKSCTETQFIPTNEIPTPCIALFEGQWFRGLSLYTTEDKAHIFFVDFGNYDMVSFSNLRQIPSKFIQHPALAVICTVIDVPGNISDKEFEEICKPDLYEVEVMEEENGYMIRFLDLFK